MTPAEHRARAEYLLEKSDAVSVEKAQVHATLALAPQQPAQPPQQRIDTSKPVHVYDIAGDFIEVAKASGGGVFLAHDGAGFGTVIEDPAKIRLFAAALTAHADRLEPKP